MGPEVSGGVGGRSSAIRQLPPGRARWTRAPVIRQFSTGAGAGRVALDGHSLSFQVPSLPSSPRWVSLVPWFATGGNREEAPTRDTLQENRMAGLVRRNARAQGPEATCHTCACRGRGSRVAVTRGLLQTAVFYPITFSSFSFHLSTHPAPVLPDCTPGTLCPWAGLEPWEELTREANPLSGAPVIQPRLLRQGGLQGLPGGSTGLGEAAPWAELPSLTHPDWRL